MVDSGRTLHPLRVVRQDLLRRRSTLDRHLRERVLITAIQASGTPILVRQFRVIALDMRRDMHIHIAPMCAHIHTMRGHIRMDIPHMIMDTDMVRSHTRSVSHTRDTQMRVRLL